MHKDPDMTWEGEFPYDVLEPAGVTAYSSIREITNSMGYFTLHGIPAGLHQSWSTLGTIKGRLFVDFFLYRIEMPETIKEEENA